MRPRYAIGEKGKFSSLLIKRGKRLTLPPS